ncbi:hypothetical protein [Rossellomorea marisflavi]|uniref:hypothetical protein n=1 Tax=Rossellomorea marisflavi TaxID=189381 RepID=UPI00345E057A
MNTSNLSAGQIFKNYKEITTALSEPIKSGNAKKAQLKEWERYFKHDKEGNKFIITHIYNVPLPENHNRTKYISTIEKLIIDKIMKSDQVGRVFISKAALLKELKMINQNYTFAKYKQLRLSKHMNITLEEIEDFYLTSDSLLKRNIEAALTSLRNQSLIFWTNAITLCIVNSTAQINGYNQIKTSKHETINEYGEEEVDFTVSNPTVYREYRKADKEEVKLILKLERETLNKYGCDSISDIFKKGLSKRFYKDVRDQLFEVSNIFFYFNSYEIIANEEHLLEKWDELTHFQMEEEEANEQKCILNEDIINRINENINKRHERSSEKYLLGGGDKKTLMRTDKKYIVNSNILTETLIYKGAESIKESLENM